MGNTENNKLFRRGYFNLSRCFDITWGEVTQLMGKKWNTIPGLEREKGRYELTHKERCVFFP